MGDIKSLTWVDIFLILLFTAIAIVILTVIINFCVYPSIKRRLAEKKEGAADENV